MSETNEERSVALQAGDALIAAFVRIEENIVQMNTRIKALEAEVASFEHIKQLTTSIDLEEIENTTRDLIAHAIEDFDPTEHKNFAYAVRDEMEGSGVLHKILLRILRNDIEFTVEVG